MDDMDELAPFSRGIARALIAGLLAWVFVMQGLAAAASARGYFDVGAVSSDLDRCSRGDDDDRGNSPGRHIPCPCCIPSRSIAMGGLAGLPPAPPECADIYSPETDIIRFDWFLIADMAWPPGWISSWSQRAPPIV